MKISTKKLVVSVAATLAVASACSSGAGESVQTDDASVTTGGSTGGSTEVARSSPRGH